MRTNRAAPGAAAAMAAMLWAAILCAAGPLEAQEAGERGVFDYWLLSLSWSPAYCEGARNPEESQCGADRRFAFVVHGLWPQHEAGGWPQFCPGADRRRRDVPEDIAAAMLPIMPSERLIEHQWDKHGTCSGLPLDDFFALTRAALARVTIPDRFQAPADAFRLPVAAIEEAFAAANPGLDGAGIAVSCRGRFLSEVRLCLDKELNFRACGRDVRDSCRGEALVRPVRLAP